MKLVPAFSLAALLAVVPPGHAEDCTDPAVADSYVCLEVLVEYDPATFDAAALVSKYDLELAGVVPPPIAEALFRAPARSDVPQLVADLSLEQALGVIEAERNTEFVFPECRQLGLAILELGPESRDAFHAQEALATVDVPAVPDRLLGGGVTVAVVDTGVSRSHPELDGFLRTPGIDLVGGTELADDVGDGIDNDGDGEVDEGVGHGTAVAGIVRLVAPGARILPVRVLDDECEGTAFGLAQGIVAAVDRGARVINLSLGSLDTVSVIGKAIGYARDRGVVIVAPAGNDGVDRLQMPARDSHVLAVAAVDDALVAPSWTNHESGVDFVAPGVGIWVPYRSGYAVVDGTSYAVAFVSAAAAIAFAIDPAADADTVAGRLAGTAIAVDATNPALDGELGDGIPGIRALVAGSLRARRERALLRGRIPAAGVLVPGPGRLATGEQPPVVVPGEGVDP